MAKIYKKIFVICFISILMCCYFIYIPKKLQSESLIRTAWKGTDKIHRFVIRLFDKPLSPEETEELVIQERLQEVLNRSSVVKLIEPGGPLPVYEELFFSHKQLPRTLNISKVKESIYLLGNVSLLLMKHNISFIMGQGTLLGSYFFHSLIPWDDDFDIFVSIRDINKLRSLFRQLEFRKTFGISSFHDPADPYNEEALKEDIPLDNTSYCGSADRWQNACHHMVKVYYHTSPLAGKQIWRYPFLDIFFTEIQWNYVINYEDHRIYRNISVPIIDFYPLVLRPLHNLWLPAPHDTKAFLQVDYRQFKCETGVWNHQFEKYNSGIKSAECRHLKSHYPYVARRPVKDIVTGEIVVGKVFEDLMLRGKLLHTVMVEQNYTSEDLMTLEQV